MKWPEGHREHFLSSHDSTKRSLLSLLRPPACSRSCTEMDGQSLVLVLGISAFCASCRSLLGGASESPRKELTGHTNEENIINCSQKFFILLCHHDHRGELFMLELI